MDKQIVLLDTKKEYIEHLLDTFFTELSCDLFKYKYNIINTSINIIKFEFIYFIIL